MTAFPGNFVSNTSSGSGGGGGAVTQSGTWNVGILGAIPIGSNTIGAVTQSGTWNLGTIASLVGALPTGANTIGSVTQANIDASAGSTAGGTAGTKSLQTGGVYNTTPPTLTNGQQAAVQFSVNGRLITQDANLALMSSSTSATTGPTIGLAALGMYNSAGVTLTTGQSVATQMTPTGQIMVASGGYTFAVQVVPTVQAAAYTAGQVIGGMLTLTNLARIATGTGIIQSATAAFVSGVLPSLDVIFFSANPTASTLSDKTAVAVATADIGKVIGVMHLTDTTLLGASAPSIIQAEQQAMPYNAASASSIYAAVVTRSAITLTSTTDMTLTIRALQD